MLPAGVMAPRVAMCWVGLPRSLWFECRAGWQLRTICADPLKETKSGTFLGPMPRGYAGPVKLIA